MKSWKDRLDLNILESVGLQSIHLHLFRDILRQLWYEFGTNLGRIWEKFGTTMGQFRDSPGATWWLLSGYWQSVSVACGQHMAIFISFLFWGQNWFIYDSDGCTEQSPQKALRLLNSLCTKYSSFNNCPQFWLKLKPLVVPMVSRDRAHVSTCPLIFQYYSTG